MRPPNIFGWTALDAGPPRDPKWLAIKDVRFPIAAPSSNTPDVEAHLIDLGVNNRLSYLDEPLTEWRAPSLGATVGDCVDYALIKRAYLIAAGFHPDDMALLTARDTLALGAPQHALLLVDTGDTDLLVLDSRNSLTLAASRVLGYEPIIAYGDSHEWVYGE